MNNNLRTLKRAQNREPRETGQEDTIRITYDTLIKSVSALPGSLSAYQILRKQPLPIKYRIMLIEMAKEMEDKVNIFNEAIGELRLQYPDSNGFQKACDDLLKQEVSLKGGKIPSVLLTDSRMSTDDHEALLWLIE